MKLGPYKLDQIYTGDARELAKAIPDESIDLIFTDPPYPHEFLPLFSDLSAIAARVLKPGGLCLAYTGKTALPEVIKRMSEYLDYYWLFDIYEPGPGVSLWNWHLFGNHRPILAFSKGIHRRERWLHDAILGNGRDKDFHEWGQSLADAEYYIYSLTVPQDLVFDPFIGGGTIPAACKMLGRHWLGFEIDPAVAERARLRVLETQPPLFIPEPEQTTFL